MLGSTFDFLRFVLIDYDKRTLQVISKISDMENTCALLHTIVADYECGGLHHSLYFVYKVPSSYSVKLPLDRLSLPQGILVFGALQESDVESVAS